MDAKLEYKALSVFYFILTFTLIGFAIVALVQGIVVHVAGSLLLGLLHYAAAPFLVMGSYITFRKGYYKLHVLAMARK